VIENKPSALEKKYPSPDRNRKPFEKTAFFLLGAKKRPQEALFVPRKNRLE
jgi:hypothetical protein